MKRDGKSFRAIPIIFRWHPYANSRWETSVFLNRCKAGKWKKARRGIKIYRERLTSHQIESKSVQWRRRRRFYSWIFFSTSGQIDHLTINSNHTGRWLLITNEIPRALPDEEKITALQAGAEPPFGDRGLFSLSLSSIPSPSSLSSYSAFFERFRSRWVIGN